MLIWGVGYVRFSYYASFSCCEGRGSRELLVKGADGIVLILMITFPAQVNSEKNCLVGRPCRISEAVLS